MKFDWNKNRELKNEWKELYSKLYDIIKDGNEYAILAPLFTMVMTEPNVFKKSQIISIVAVNDILMGEFMSLKIENEDGQSFVNVYPQFELKTDGKIKDIVLILMFIKDNIISHKTIKTDIILL